MRFDLDGLDVFFPYEYLYREQYEYMLNLKRAIDDKGHALLEMPTGTGKTVCLISLITSYQFQYPQHTGKLIYWLVIVETFSLLFISSSNIMLIR